MPRHFVVLYGLWALLATASLAWSADPGYTLAELRREVLYGALAFGVFFHAATSAGRLRLWGGALLAGTVALALFEIVRAHAAPGLAPWHGGPGRFSTHLALVAPFLLLLGLGPPEGFGRRAGLAGIAIACFGIAALDTHNRIVWASFLVALVTLAIAMAPVVTAPARRRLALGTILAAATLGALFALSLSQKLDVSYPTAASTASAARCSSATTASGCRAPGTSSRRTATTSSSTPRSRSGRPGPRCSPRCSPRSRSSTAATSLGPAPACSARSGSRSSRPSW
jgi:hypothetical protein